MWPFEVLIISALWHILINAPFCPKTLCKSSVWDSSRGNAGWRSTTWVSLMPRGKHLHRHWLCTCERPRFKFWWWQDGNRHMWIPPTHASSSESLSCFLRPKLPRQALSSLSYRSTRWWYDKVPCGFGITWMPSVQLSCLLVTSNLKLSDTFYRIPYCFS